jgi:hypothetical protein
MSRALIIAIYYLSGGLISAIVAAKMHLGVAVVACVLALLYIGHLCWTRFQQRPITRAAEACLACHQRIDWRRRLSNHRFCSDAHESEWLNELEGIAIERLQVARGADPEPIMLRKPVVHEETEGTVSAGEFALALANR